jgi:tetratricopeptide (TPR) repeat protein
MKVKLLIIGCALLVMSAGAYAQKSVLNSAKTNYDKFSGLKNPNTMSLALPSLTAAKESIDKAVAHEKTKDDPSAWTYRALIYADLALLDSVPANTEPLVAEATNSIKKATELDKEGQNKAQLETAGRLLAQYNLNKGVRAFQNKTYEEAYAAFNNGLTYLPGDTTFSYYAGLAAINMKDYGKAIEKYNNLLNTKFSNLPSIYLDLSRIYAMQKDTVNAIKMASEGSQKFPENSQLATQEIELSLMAGKQKEVIDKITAQSAKEPGNKTLPFYLGIAYNSMKDYPKAEEAYKKAIAIDPNFVDANLNVGSLIMNNGIELYNAANKLPANKQTEYTAMMKKAMAEFDRAFPYLQKSVELDPKSRIGLENLRTYYLVKKNSEKATEIKKQIDALQ